MRAECRTTDPRPKDTEIPARHVATKPQEMANSSDLIALVYSEFDNQVGPQIVFQVPEEYALSRFRNRRMCCLMRCIDVCNGNSEISREDFDTISDYVIVAKHLCEHLMSVCIHDLQVLSYPICIEHEKVR